MLIRLLKSLLMPTFLLLSILAFAHGGAWLWAPFLGVTSIVILGDWLLPQDLSPPGRGGWLLDLPIYLSLPLLLVFNGLLLWLLADHDVGGLAAFVREHFGHDLDAARSATNAWWMWLGGIVSAGFFNSGVGTVAGHELTHRTSRPFDLIIGRWLLGLTCDTSFAIEHVYGHHARVATPDDPATARRGEGFYSFAWRSTIHSFTHAFALDQARLAKSGRSVWNPLVSPFMRGMVQNLVFFIAAGMIAGWAGVALWALIAFVGKEHLEIQNYFAHYGLVREPGQPVQPRHSWNSNHWMSTNVLYSLARHSHHHAEASAPYYSLRAYRDAPALPGGYLVMLLVVLVPPLYKAIMRPALDHWDAHYATPGERALARQQSLNCGMDLAIARTAVA